MTKNKEKQSPVKVKNSKERGIPSNISEEEEMEEIQDKVLNNYLYGITRPWQMANRMNIDYKTAVKYIKLAKTRLSEVIKDTNRVEILKKELVSLDYLELVAWDNIKNADNVNHTAGIINTIVKIKEKKFELLDLKNIIYKVIKEEPEKSEDDKPLDFQSHDWLILKMKADGIIRMNEEYKQGKRDRYGKRIKKDESDV